MKLISAMTIIMLFGCASTPPPKETVRDIFSLIKDGRVRQAETIYNKTPDGVPFEVYGDSVKAINAREMDRLVSVSIDFINSCEMLVDRIKEITTEYNIHYSDPVDPVKSEFENKCNVSANKALESDFTKIKSISTVDFFPEYESFKAQFATEIAKVDSILNEKKQTELELEESAKKKVEYEKSPEFYVKKLCEMQDIINTASNIIEKENEAGKISGFVNKKRLYEAGKAIQTNTDRIKYFSNEYEVKFNKSWSSKDCR